MDEILSLEQAAINARLKVDMRKEEFKAIINSISELKYKRDADQSSNTIAACDSLNVCDEEEEGVIVEEGFN